MLDYNTLVLDPNYLIHGVPAVIRLAAGGVVEGITVIDKSNPVEVGENAVRGQTLAPACIVRYKELTAAGVTAADLPDSQVIFNDFVWEVTSTKPKPTPRGELDGELYLFITQLHSLESEESSS